MKPVSNELTKNDQTSLKIGIDLGGTKIALCAFKQWGNELYRTRIPTPQSVNPEDIVVAIRTLVHDAEKSLGETGAVGIGTPGSVSALTGKIRNSNTQCLNGFDLKAALEKALQREVRLSNDANCFALSEALYGAGRGAKTVFAVILGTGVGGGVVINGQVLQGVNGVAGEWGHNPLPWIEKQDAFPRPCYCGKQQCIEQFLSGPGASRCFELESGRLLSLPEIVSAATEGDIQAEAFLNRYEDRLARALASVINVIDPEVIVLGGGVSNVSRWYQNVPTRWGEYVFSDAVKTRLVQAQHGDDSGVLGAAMLTTLKWQ